MPLGYGSQVDPRIARQGLARALIQAGAPLLGVQGSYDPGGALGAGLGAGLQSYDQYMMQMMQLKRQQEQDQMRRDEFGLRKDRFALEGEQHEFNREVQSRALGMADMELTAKKERAAILTKGFEDELESLGGDENARALLSSGLASVESDPDRAEALLTSIQQEALASGTSVEGGDIEKLFGGRGWSSILSKWHDSGAVDLDSVMRIGEGLMQTEDRYKDDWPMAELFRFSMAATSNDLEQWPLMVEAAQSRGEAPPEPPDAKELLIENLQRLGQRFEKMYGPVPSGAGFGTDESDITPVDEAARGMRSAGVDKERARAILLEKYKGKASDEQINLLVDRLWNFK